jgi:nucleoside-diphosphate-sugar epimerase
MNVLVTGATGFLGRHLVKALCQKGYKVRALVRSTSNLAGLTGLDIETVAGDVTDRGSLIKAADGRDLVFHCAGRVVEWGKREDFYRVNVEGTKNILEACLASGVKRFVHASSVTVLGVSRDRSPMDENTPYTDRSFELYTETKILSEKLVLEYHNKKGLPITIVRPGLVWGPGDTTIFPRIEKLAAKGALLNIGKGDNLLCLAYISNVVQALILAAESPKAVGRIYNITDDEKKTSRTFLAGLAKAMDLKPPTYAIPFRLLFAGACVLEAAAKLMGLSEPPLITRYGLCILGCDFNHDISKAKRELGYKPQVSYAEGMQNVTQWYKDRQKGTGSY